MQNVFNKNLLKGKNILITGASSGIGFETAIELAKLGANLIVVGRSSEKLFKLKKIVENFSNVLIINFDLEKKDAGVLILQSVPFDFLPLDGIFHSAGLFIIKPFSLLEQNEFDKLLSISLNTLFSFAKLFHKKKYFNDSSSIVVMSSVASNFGTSGLGFYSAIKSAVNSSCKTMAIEFSRRNIRVNAIVAGAIKTEMHNTIVSNLSDGAFKEYENKHPLGFGDPEDISNIVCFLMSNASKWITGSLITVDGGYSAKK